LHNPNPAVCPPATPIQADKCLELIESIGGSKHTPRRCLALNLYIYAKKLGIAKLDDWITVANKILKWCRRSKMLAHYSADYKSIMKFALPDCTGLLERWRAETAKSVQAKLKKNLKLFKRINSTFDQLS
jgi:hypothetical protein